MVKTFKIFFSRTNGLLALKGGMLHQIHKYHQDCSNDDLGLTLTFLREGQLWETANTLDFMESFEYFSLKMEIRVVLISTLRFVSRRGHAHCLTFDPGLS